MQDVKKKRQKIWCVLIGGGFAFALLLVMLLGLVQTLLFPEELCDYENRYAYQVEAPTVEGYLYGSFQSGMDNALGDQVTLSTTFKKLYSALYTKILTWCSEPVKRSGLLDGRYIRLDQTLLFGPEQLVYAPYPAERAEELNARIADYNRVFAAFPQVTFSLYYIEKDTDIQFETGEKRNFYETLCDGLSLPDEQTVCFTIDSFAEFQQYFYRTDHHWNADGAYRGYLDVLKLLGCEEAPLVPEERIALPGEMTGSKALSGGVMFSETVTAYRYAYPEMTITVNGAPAVNYGNQDAYLRGEMGEISYSMLYGEDHGEVVLTTGREERERLLVIGESYDNAILKLLASHYQTTYAVDLRYYEAEMGEPFRLSEYLAEHEIDRVLLIGNIDYYLMPEFELGE